MTTKRPARARRTSSPTGRSADLEPRATRIEASLAVNEDQLIRLEHWYDQTFGDGSPGSFLATLDVAGLDPRWLPTAMSEMLVARFRERSRDSDAHLQAARIGLLHLRAARHLMARHDERYATQISQAVANGFMWLGKAQQVSVEHAELKRQAQADVELKQSKDRRKRAAVAGRARFMKSPAGRAKQAMKSEWLRWQQQPALHQNKTAFDYAMLDQYPEVHSRETVEGWRLQWQEEAGKPPTT